MPITRLSSIGGGARRRVGVPVAVASVTAAIGLCGVASTPAHAAVRTVGPVAYVVDHFGGTVIPIPVRTGTPGTPIPVGSSPGDEALSPNHKKLFVTIGGSNDVTSINTDTNTAGAAIPVGVSPIRVLFTPDGKTAYVLADGLLDDGTEVDSTVTPINVAKGTAKPAIPVGSGGDLEWALTPDGSTLYVAGDDVLYPINTATNTVGAAIPIPAEAEALVATSTNVWVSSDFFSDSSGDVGDVYSVSEATGAVSPLIEVDGMPQSMTITPDGSQLFVASRLDSVVTPINTATHLAGTPISMPTDPRWMAFSPDGATLYVASAIVNAVTPISTATDTAGTPISLPSQPQAIAVAPQGHNIYVSEGGATGQPAEVSPIKARTGVVGAPIAAGEFPDTIVFKP
jgi:YVTN family beta-propeller protein